MRANKSTGRPTRTHLSLRVHLRLATVRNLLMRESREIAARWDLTLPQFDVLVELARTNANGFTFAELSRVLLVTSGNLTGIVDRLEARSLVRRQPDPKDRRLIRIVLTDPGRAMAEDMMPQHADHILAALSFIPRNGLLELNQLLGILRDGLRQRDSDRRALARNGMHAQKKR